MRYVFVWVFPDFWTQCTVLNGNTFFESLVLSLNFFFLISLKEKMKISVIKLVTPNL
jgi:hypothetical protein